MPHESGIPSAAQVSGHPIHPMLIPFPIAYLIGALLSDFTYLATEDPFWARASMWLIGAGLVMGATAAIFGLIDFFSRPAIRGHRIAWHHFIGNASVLILALINLTMRIDTPIDGLTPNGVVLSLITVGILFYTGWLGGEMVHRYRIGTTPSGSTVRSTTRTPSGNERRMGPDDRRLAM
jgi:uncharacterized membrane protein